MEVARDALQISAGELRTLWGPWQDQRCVQPAVTAAWTGFSWRGAMPSRPGTSFWVCDRTFLACGLCLLGVGLFCVDARWLWKHASCEARSWGHVHAQRSVVVSSSPHVTGGSYFDAKSWVERTKMCMRGLTPPRICGPWWLAQPFGSTDCKAESCHGAVRSTRSAGRCGGGSLPKLHPVAGEIHAAEAVALLIPGRPLSSHSAELNIFYHLLLSDVIPVKPQA